MDRSTVRTLALALVPGLALVQACSGADMNMSGEMDMGGGAGGDYGVTPGGAQDIGYVRDIIEQGYLPDLESWRAEGLFSEHDLPLSGDACQLLLCPRAAAATLPLDQAMVVQVGFGTNLDAESWERDPLSLAIAVDISGSMADGKLDAVKTALRSLSAQVDRNDRVSLVAFDDIAELRLPLTVMDDAGRVALRDAIADLHEDGATNIEAGLKKAYQQVAPLAEPNDGIGDRVMIFTDAMPNVGNTGVDSFVGMAQHYGELGIGITVFGTGLDLGAELANEIGEVRGGNYVYLPDPEHIGTIFDNAFDFLVSPIAYDLEIELRTQDGWRFVDAVGAPLDDPGQVMAFGAASLFLSNNDGGMAVMLARDPAFEGDALAEADERLASFHVTYEEADSGEIVEDDLMVDFDGGQAWQSESLGIRSPKADDLGVYKMAFLLDEVDALTAVGQFCEGSLTAAEAADAIADARARLSAAGQEIPDAGLTAEAELMRQLAENLEGGRNSCWTSY